MFPKLFPPHDKALLLAWQREVDIVRAAGGRAVEAESALRLAKMALERTLLKLEEGKNFYLFEGASNEKVEIIKARATYWVAFADANRELLGNDHQEAVWLSAWLDRAIDVADYMGGITYQKWYLGGRKRAERTELLERVLGFRPYREDWLEELSLPNRSRERRLKGILLPRIYMNRRLFAKIECRCDSQFDQLHEHYSLSKRIRSSKRLKSYTDVEQAFYRLASENWIGRRECFEIARKILDFVAGNSKSEDRLYAIAALAVSAYEPAFDWGFYPLANQIILESKERFLSSSPINLPITRKWHQKLLEALKSA